MVSICTKLVLSNFLTDGSSFENLLFDGHCIVRKAVHLVDIVSRVVGLGPTVGLLPRVRRRPSAVAANPEMVLAAVALDLVGVGGFVQLAGVLGNLMKAVFKNLGLINSHLSHYALKYEFKGRFLVKKEIFATNFNNLLFTII